MSCSNAGDESENQAVPVALAVRHFSTSRVMRVSMPR
jgi:hypothetical protein